MPTIDQLLGDWTSTHRHPLHLGTDGFILRFHFDELPFEDGQLAHLSIVDQKKSDIILAGSLQIEGSVNDEFFLIVNTVRIPARQFSENRFIADIVNYGIVEFAK